MSQMVEKSTEERNAASVMLDILAGTKNMTAAEVAVEVVIDGPKLFNPTSNTAVLVYAHVAFVGQVCSSRSSLPPFLFQGSTALDLTPSGHKRIRCISRADSTTISARADLVRSEHAKPASGPLGPPEQSQCQF